MNLWIRVSRLYKEQNDLVMFGPGGITALEKTDDGELTILRGKDSPADGWEVEDSINTLEAHITIAMRGKS
jgi:hypothetical protein